MYLVVMPRAMNWKVGKDALIQNIADTKYLPTLIANLICNLLHVFYFSVLIFTDNLQIVIIIYVIFITNVMLIFWADIADLQ